MGQSSNGKKSECNHSNRIIAVYVKEKKRSLQLTIQLSEGHGVRQDQKAKENDTRRIHGAFPVYFHHLYPYHYLIARYACQLGLPCNQIYPHNCNDYVMGQMSSVASSSKQYDTFLQSGSQNCEKRLLAPSCLSVRLCVRMEKLYSHWTDFHEI